MIFLSKLIKHLFRKYRNQPGLYYFRIFPIYLLENVFDTYVPLTHLPDPPLSRERGESKRGRVRKNLPLSKLHLCTFFLSIIFLHLCQSQDYYMQQWPGFRGPYATGILDHASTPVTWDVETGENIKWKIPIPGLGHSCPVIWEDMLFITTAISGKGEDYLKVGIQWH